MSMVIENRYVATVQCMFAHVTLLLVSPAMPNDSSVTLIDKVVGGVTRPTVADRGT